jgi:hypothetical protein
VTRPAALHCKWCILKMLQHHVAKLAGYKNINNFKRLSVLNQNPHAFVITGLLFRHIGNNLHTVTSTAIKTRRLYRLNYRPLYRSPVLIIPCFSRRRSRGSSDSSDWITGRITWLLFPAGSGIFSVRHRVHTGSGTHPGSYLMGTGVSFPGSKAAGARTWLQTST